MKDLSMKYSRANKLNETLKKQVILMILVSFLGGYAYSNALTTNSCKDLLSVTTINSQNHKDIRAHAISELSQTSGELAIMINWESNFALSFNSNLMIHNLSLKHQIQIVTDLVTHNEYTPEGQDKSLIMNSFVFHGEAKKLKAFIKEIDLPNARLVHYENLNADIPQQTTTLVSVHIDQPNKTQEILGQSLAQHPERISLVNVLGIHTPAGQNKSLLFAIVKLSTFHHYLRNHTADFILQHIDESIKAHSHGSSAFSLKNLDNQFAKLISILNKFDVVPLFDDVNNSEPMIIMDIPTMLVLQENIQKQNARNSERLNRQNQLRPFLAKYQTNQNPSVEAAQTQNQTAPVVLAQPTTTTHGSTSQTQAQAKLFEDKSVAVNLTSTQIPPERTIFSADQFMSRKTLPFTVDANKEFNLNKPTLLLKKSNRNAFLLFHPEYFKKASTEQLVSIITAHLEPGRTIPSGIVGFIKAYKEKYNSIDLGFFIRDLDINREKKSRDILSAHFLTSLPLIVTDSTPAQIEIMIMIPLSGASHNEFQKAPPETKPVAATVNTEAIPTPKLLSLNEFSNQLTPASNSLQQNLAALKLTPVLVSSEFFKQNIFLVIHASYFKQFSRESILSLIQAQLVGKAKIPDSIVRFVKNYETTHSTTQNTPQFYSNFAEILEDHFARKLLPTSFDHSYPLTINRDSSKASPAEFIMIPLTPNLSADQIMSWKDSNSKATSTPSPKTTLAKSPVAPQISSSLSSDRIVSYDVFRSRKTLPFGLAAQTEFTQAKPKLLLKGPNTKSFLIFNLDYVSHVSFEQIIADIHAEIGKDKVIPKSIQDFVKAYQQNPNQLNHVPHVKRPLNDINREEGTTPLFNDAFENSRALIITEDRRLGNHDKFIMIPLNFSEAPATTGENHTVETQTTPVAKPETAKPETPIQAPAQSSVNTERVVSVMDFKSRIALPFGDKATTEFTKENPKVLIENHGKKYFLILHPSYLLHSKTEQILADIQTELGPNISIPKSTKDFVETYQHSPAKLQDIPHYEHNETEIRITNPTITASLNDAYSKSQAIIIMKNRREGTGEKFIMIPLNPTPLETKVVHQVQVVKTERQVEVKPALTSTQNSQVIRNYPISKFFGKRRGSFDVGRENELSEKDPTLLLTRSGQKYFLLVNPNFLKKVSFDKIRELLKQEMNGAAIPKNTEDFVYYYKTDKLNSGVHYRTEALISIENIYGPSVVHPAFDTGTVIIMTENREPNSRVMFIMLPLNANPVAEQKTIEHASTESPTHISTVKVSAAKAEMQNQISAEKTETKKEASFTAKSYLDEDHLDLELQILEDIINKDLPLANHRNFAHAFEQELKVPAIHQAAIEAMNISQHDVNNWLKKYDNRDQNEDFNRIEQILINLGFEVGVHTHPISLYKQPLMPAPKHAANVTLNTHIANSPEAAAVPAQAAQLNALVMAKSSKLSQGIEHTSAPKISSAKLAPAVQSPQATNTTSKQVEPTVKAPEAKQIHTDAPVKKAIDEDKLINELSYLEQIIQGKESEEDHQELIRNLEHDLRQDDFHQAAVQLIGLTQVQIHTWIKNHDTKEKTKTFFTLKKVLKTLGFDVELASQKQSLIDRVIKEASPEEQRVLNKIAFHPELESDLDFIVNTNDRISVLRTIALKIASGSLDSILYRHSPKPISKAISLTKSFHLRFLYTKSENGKLMILFATHKDEKNYKDKQLLDDSKLAKRYFEASQL